MNRRGWLFVVLGSLLAAAAVAGGGRWLWRTLRALHGGGRRPHS
jgi:hypothetical protein